MWTRTLSTTISTRPLALGSSLAMAGLSHADPAGRAQRRAAGTAEPRTTSPTSTPGDEPADVGEERDATTRAGVTEGGEAGHHLDQEPQPEDDDRGHLDELVEEPEIDQGLDAGPG